MMRSLRGGALREGGRGSPVSHCLRFGDVLSTCSTKKLKEQAVVRVRRDTGELT